MNFEVHGEFGISITHGRRIDRSSISAFWQEVDKNVPGLSGANGCYLFGVSSSGADMTMPWYVGMTTKSFKSECFQPHKILYYDDALHEYQRGGPMMFLMPKRTPTGRFAGSGKAKDIQFLEKFLIGVALKRNPDLLNKRDTKMYKEIYVPGLVNASRGNPGAAARRLKKSLGM